MKNVAAFSALVAGAAAQSYFGVTASRSGASGIHQQSLTARGGKFYLGGEPSSYCPPQVAVCPPGDRTVLAGGDSTLSLGVVVPGGQQVYVAPDGTLSYTSPHSAFKPEGSVVDGWTKVAGEPFGTLTFTNGGLVACPTNSTGQGWQVYGQIPSATIDPACLGFSALTVTADGPGAWQY